MDRCLGQRYNSMDGSVYQNLDQCHILEMNDDCFYQIYEYLPPIDWCSLRETCTRLRATSDYWFARQSRSFNLQPEIIYGSLCRPKANDTKRMIRNFGQFFTTLRLYRYSFGSDEEFVGLFPLLDRYCLALEDLEFYGCRLPVETIIHCERLFSNLHRLILHQWTNEEAIDYCLAHCVSLKEFKLSHMYYMKGSCLARHRIESLETFTMGGCKTIKFEFLEKFFAKNRQLKAVKLVYNTFETEEAIVCLEDAAITLPNLDSLTLLHNTNFNRRLIPAPMPAVKKLEVDLRHVEENTFDQISSDLTANSNVEILRFSYDTLNDVIIERLCTLKTLQILKFGPSKSDFDGKMCKKLAIELPALLEIHFYGFCRGVTFNEIEQIVVHSTNLKRVVYIGYDRLTKEKFWSLIEALKKKQRNESLSVFLGSNDLDNIIKEFEANGISKMLTDHSHIIKLLPLEEEHRKF